MSNFHREVLSSDIDPMDIVIVTCMHDPAQGTWEEFTATVKEMYPGQEQELISHSGRFGVKLRLLQKKTPPAPKKEKEKDRR